MPSPYRNLRVYGEIAKAWSTGFEDTHSKLSGAAEAHGAEDKQSNHASQNKRYHFLSSKAEL